MELKGKRAFTKDFHLLYEFFKVLINDAHVSGFKAISSHSTFFEDKLPFDFLFWLSALSAASVKCEECPDNLQNGLRFLYCLYF